MLARQLPRVRASLTSVTRSNGAVRAFSAAGPAELDASKTTIVNNTNPPPMLEPSELVFGTSFTGHMLDIDWDIENGWHAPQIRPFGDLVLHPAVGSLHYALQCFEGLKAYRGAKGEARLFRPDMNMKRFNNSMQRLMLPTCDTEQHLECIKQLIREDDQYIPSGDGYSLYIRPTGISTQPTLGVGMSTQAKIFTILSPVGPYYSEGFKPVNLFATNKVTRAWPGGTGSAKIGGNYAPTIRPQMEAAKEGFSQILWLYGEQNDITEVGTMNMFIFWKNAEGEDELVTAPLDGTVLPGITRDSTIGLAKEFAEFKVTERFVRFEELIVALQEGRVYECFGTGTAAVVSPIGSIHHEGVDYEIPFDEELQAGKFAMRLWNTLADIQYGRVEHPWSVVV